MVSSKHPRLGSVLVDLFSLLSLVGEVLNLGNPSSSMPGPDNENPFWYEDTSNFEGLNLFGEYSRAVVHSSRALS